MISISGIKYQKELESLPYFTKPQAGMLVGKSGKNLDAKLAQLKRIGYLNPLKNSLYVSSAYVQAVDSTRYGEYVANVLRVPSYVSLEYVLAREGIISEGIMTVTSVTLKSSRTYQNPLSTFTYRNIKPELFTGYKQLVWDNKIIYCATRMKALFDYLYLTKLLRLKTELTVDLRINWGVFNVDDVAEFYSYVEISGSRKMAQAAKFIKKLIC